MTDVSTTCVVVIFRVKVSFIMSVDGLKLFHQWLNAIDKSLTSALAEKKCRDFFASSNFFLSDQPKLLSSRPILKLFFFFLVVWVSGVLPYVEYILLPSTKFKQFISHSTL